MKCSSFSYSFQGTCSWLCVHLGYLLTWAYCDFLAGFWICHKGFLDCILLSFCLCGGLRSGASYPIILVISLYKFYNKRIRYWYQKAPYFTALNESICPHPGPMLFLYRDSRANGMQSMKIKYHLENNDLCY